MTLYEDGIVTEIPEELSHSQTEQTIYQPRPVRYRQSRVMRTPDTEELNNVYKEVEDDSINRGLSPITETTLLPIRDRAFIDYSEDGPVTEDALSLLSQASRDQATISRSQWPRQGALRPPVQMLDDIFSHAARRTQGQYTEVDIIRITQLLEAAGWPQWSKMPRVYTILRTIGQLHRMDDFVDQRINDYWLPFDSHSLPRCLSPSACTHFQQAQNLILTNSRGYVDFENCGHAHFTGARDMPFKTKCVLGRGRFGEVDQVQHLITSKMYARKLLPRPDPGSESAFKAMNSFLTELEILKKLSHHHTIKLVASYTDERYIGLFLWPVADCTLTEFLRHATAAAAVGERALLRTFFGCLAAALDYLHGCNIRHKDVKPSNILVKDEAVLLSDFGISRDYGTPNDPADLIRSTTAGPTAKTPRYCAPEVAKNEKRNTSSDVWSLGCVYLEMVSVLKGESSEKVVSFLERNGMRDSCFYANPSGVTAWINHLAQTPRDNEPLLWIRKTLRENREHRPTTGNLLRLILSKKSPEASMIFCGQCCCNTSRAAEPEFQVTQQQSIGGDHSRSTSTSMPHPETLGKAPNDSDYLGAKTRIRKKPNLAVPDFLSSSSSGMALTRRSKRTPLSFVQDTETSYPTTLSAPKLPSGSKTTLIFEAIQAKDLEQVNRLLEQKIDITVRDSNEWTPLHHCSCLVGQTDILVQLIDYGSNIEARDSDGHTPLHIACSHGAEDIVRMLIRYGADIEAMTQDQQTPLHITSVHEAPRLVQLLLDAGAQVEARADEYTPLHLASQHGCTAAVAVLLQNGAHIEAVGTNYWTSLHLACGFAQYNTTRMLLECGASVWARDHAFWTPLHQACRKNDASLLELLIVNGADIEAEAVNCMTPLQLAAYCGLETSAIVLLRYGADARVAPETARQQGHHEIHAILQAGF